MTTEEWMSKLKNEDIALKQSFQRAATTMDFYKKEISISTSKNNITISGPGGTYTSTAQERIILTFDTDTGANTIPILEMDCSSEIAPLVRQRIHDGGAEYVITNQPGYDSNANWIPTEYTFVLYTLVDGELSVGMASS